MKQNEHGGSEFFCNRECEYFPCHVTDTPQDFNCLFCYCPLYALGEKCGGDFAYTPQGIKDCSGCLVPHKKENYERIVRSCAGIVEIAKKK